MTSLNVRILFCLRQLHLDWRTVATAVKTLNARPYKKQKTPQLDERIRKQRLAYAQLGPVAQLVASGEWESKKHTLAFVDHTPTAKEGVVNSSHDPCWRTPEDKKKNGIPSGGSSKYSIKPQVWLAVSYDVKVLYIHANRMQKKRSGPTIKPEYRLALKGINAKELSYVVEEEFGQTLQDAGVETVIVGNDRKARCKIVRDACAKFGIQVWSGAGIVGDRKLVSEFTDQETENLGGFPVNSPDCMTND